MRTSGVTCIYNRGGQDGGVGDGQAAAVAKLYRSLQKLNDNAAHCCYDNCERKATLSSMHKDIEEFCILRTRTIPHFVSESIALRTRSSAPQFHRELVEKW